MLRTQQPMEVSPEVCWCALTSSASTALDHVWYISASIPSVHMVQLCVDSNASLAHIGAIAELVV